MTNYTPGLLILLAFVVRGGFVAGSLPSLSADPDSYRAFANQIITRGEYARAGSDGLPILSAYRPPLYPFVLAITGTSNERIAILHTILGVATVLLTFLIAQRLNMGNASWLAAGWVLCDPILLEQSRLVMTETLATFLGVLALWGWVTWSHEKRWFGPPLIGLLMGFAVLCRPIFLVWIVFSLVPLMWAERNWRARLRSCSLFILSAAIVLMPWAVRNYYVFNQPIITTTHGGYTLLLGNNAFFYRFVRQGNWTTAWDATEFQKNWSAIDQVYHAEHELKTDALANDWARGVMRCDASGWLLATIYREWQLFSPLPNQVDIRESRQRYWLRMLVAAWYVLMYAAMMRGWFWWRWSQAKLFYPWFLALVFAVVIIHSQYWTNLRMRAPLIPGLAIAAACFAIPRGRDSPGGRGSCRAVGL